MVVTHNARLGVKPQHEPHESQVGTRVDVARPLSVLALVCRPVEQRVKVQVTCRVPANLLREIRLSKKPG